MLDIGWQELFIIALVAVVVIGPKELPRVLRTVTMAIRKLRGMASDFQNSIEELARESELQDIRRELEKTTSIDLQDELEKTIDPTGDVGRSVRELESSVSRTGEELGDPMIEAPKPALPAAENGDAPPAQEADAGRAPDVSRSGTSG